MSKSDISVFYSNNKRGDESLKISMSIGDFFENLDDILVVFDKTGNLTYSSKSIKKVLGYEYAEIEGLNWWEKVFNSVERGEAARTFFVSSFVISAKSYERKMKTSNGGLKWISWKYIRDKSDNVLCVGKDITNSKQLEYSLRTYKRRLSTKYKELDNFVYKASHDLKGPVASIMGITNIAKENVKNNSVKHYFNLIAKSSSRLNFILIDLMKISQISQEKPLVESILLNNILNQVIDRVRKNTCEEFDISYELKCDEVFNTDANMLSAIFFNLIDNSIKFKKHIPNSFVKIRIDSFGDGIKIVIVDNGVGIPDKVKHRVFEMFFRGHEYSEGTGLGLHIVKTAVEKLKGYVSIMATSKKGTTVSIFLPKLANNT